MYADSEVDEGFYSQPVGGYSGYSEHFNSELEQPYYSRGSADTPDVVKRFIQYFHRAVIENQVYDIQDLYENTYPKLSETFYERSNWPSAEAISPLVKKQTSIFNRDDFDSESNISRAPATKDDVFLMLYKELYYRHIYARHPGPSPQEREQSYGNYNELFNQIIGAEHQLELPEVWLWELMDEFIYQFQSFSQFRSKPLKSSEQPYPFLHQTWNVLCVLNVPHCLITKSNIKQQLEVQASGGDPNSVAGEFGQYPLYRMLGFFSLVALLRLHTLLGDYHQAIKSLEFVDLQKKAQYSSVPACQVTMSYYLGFGYMMMRRYTDAIRTFSSILLYLQRVKQLFQARTYQNDQINKQTEQMYHLLAICLVLHPQCIDESLQQVLKEKNFYDKILRMQNGDMQEFETCFLYACPKFVSPTTPTDDADHSKEPTQHQLRVFLEEVKQQEVIPNIRSYLKLYKTLPLMKLAALMNSNYSVEVEDEDIKLLLTHLLCFKHKMKNMVWNKGVSGLSGAFQCTSDLDFYIDNDMIHIADTKVATRHTDVFIRKIHKFDELRRKLQMLKIL